MIKKVSKKNALIGDAYRHNTGNVSNKQDAPLRITSQQQFSQEKHLSGLENNPKIHKGRPTWKVHT
jgi:hypothetical protein